MTPWIPVGISSVALLISGVTAWLSYFQRGKLRMTQPTLVFFGPDGKNNDGPKSKVYLRTLLYSTSRRGHVIESLWVVTECSTSKQTFSIWTYGEERLMRGSGLFVGPEGKTLNHHFLLPRGSDDFVFVPGMYKVRIFAKCIGSHPKEEVAPHF